MKRKFKNNGQNQNSFRGGFYIQIINDIKTLTSKVNDIWLQYGIQAHALGDYSFRSASTTNTCVGCIDNYTTSQGAIQMCAQAVSSRFG